MRLKLNKGEFLITNRINPKPRTEHANTTTPKHPPNTRHPAGPQARQHTEHPRNSPQLYPKQATPLGPRPYAENASRNRPRHPHYYRPSRTWNSPQQHAENAPQRTQAHTEYTLTRPQAPGPYTENAPPPDAQTTRINRGRPTAPRIHATQQGPDLNKNTPAQQEPNRARTQNAPTPLLPSTHRTRAQK